MLTAQALQDLLARVHSPSCCFGAVAPSLPTEHSPHPLPPGSCQVDRHLLGVVGIILNLLVPSPRLSALEHKDVLDRKSVV